MGHKSFQLCTKFLYFVPSISIFNPITNLFYTNLIFHYRIQISLIVKTRWMINRRLTVVAGKWSTSIMNPISLSMLQDLPSQLPRALTQSSMSCQLTWSRMMTFSTMIQKRKNSDNKKFKRRPKDLKEYTDRSISSRNLRNQIHVRKSQWKLIN